MGNCAWVLWTANFQSSFSEEQERQEVELDLRALQAISAPSATNGCSVERETRNRTELSSAQAGTSSCLLGDKQGWTSLPLRGLWVK